MKQAALSSVSSVNLSGIQNVTYSSSSRYIHTHKPNFVWMLILSIFLLSSPMASAKDAGKFHTIELWAERIPANGVGGNSLFAYRMASHVVSDKDLSNEIDLTANYSPQPTIPGPTIVINEGDEVELTLFHKFNPDSNVEGQVSVHVHGVHYDILSDGTIQYINLVEDESATPAMSYTYRWVAAPGTAGTWPYHDHNMLTLNGAEDRGLYGAVIVNDHSNIMTVSRGHQTNSLPFSSVEKEYVLFIGDDAFWGTEINNQTGQQTPLWHNPDLSARHGSNVRFHLIALGSNSHQFKFPGYRWIDPGTNVIIQEKAIGVLEKHVFAVQANHSSVYMDQTFISKSLGMKGHFKAIP